ncbi:uncharacterized protein N7479_001296 [Penicillium vulpinum]|uniref:Hemerythrin-like domain-containing protein n=1 Tax=Penicillium vulpinum TaxID=29845 RepID=A0A1V6RZ62_9EURO|nr:uncharacterized protein N7479_001296 [Penicillium vulpinum]KAJ5971378.1 hypothetical protein N7479_001296 [Penicillium vulpinum]OQE07082.1 hypothetical protein PENVUL_c015G00121 [Penicillium vulpinum]
MIVSGGAPIWADTPWPLIPSPKEDASKHASIHIATEMTHTHNCMLRALNSIYHQAEQLEKLEDIADFLFFIKSWSGWVSHHHTMEEEMMFPGFERVIGTPGFLGDNVEQHHAFQPHLKILQDYSVKTKPADYDASIVRRTIEEMGPSFREHLADEINSLLQMIDYDSEGLMKVHESCVVEATKQDKQVVPPMVLGLRDVTFEGGTHWPALPPMAETVVNYVFARRNSGAWRFLPCDGWGKPRPLAFGPIQEEPKK